jgi:hypothetical protein
MAGLGEQRCGDILGVSDATAPRAVRIARSAPRDSATVMPRQIVPHGHGSGAHAFPRKLAQQEIPGRISSRRREQPTLSPSRAAATAVIAADPPTTIQMPSTSF